MNSQMIKFGNVIFDPNYTKESLLKEQQAVLTAVGIAEEVFATPLFKEGATPDMISLSKLPEYEQIMAKALIKALVACHEDFQTNGFNEKILRQASLVLGRKFYVGMPHLRLHLPNDKKEESIFHSDYRLDSGITFTNWTPLLTPRGSQRLLYVPFTHLLNANSRVSGKLLTLFNRFLKKSSLFVREIVIEHGETLLFSARLWHRGNMNRESTSFLSRVIRFSQYPFAEQSYAKILIGPESTLAVEKRPGFVTIPSEYFSTAKDQLVERIQHMISLGRGLSKDSQVLDSSSILVRAKEYFAGNSKKNTLDQFESIFWAEVANYLNSVPGRKRSAQEAALLGLKNDPNCGLATALFCAAFSSFEEHDCEELLKIAPHMSAEAASIIANCIFSKSEKVSHSFREIAHAKDSNFPSVQQFFDKNNQKIALKLQHNP